MIEPLEDPNAAVNQADNDLDEAIVEIRSLSLRALFVFAAQNPGAAINQQLRPDDPVAAAQYDAVQARILAAIAAGATP